ncbi:DUF938 domain-containing protein [Denitrobaculum tricleocarpae]|uniref:DUF938 domain-containing protein n=1 Tax=Denitrobaculum tricleocarpae TaxID=2591009 RepID=A0A545TR84_9PROT|nr:DUF938 domain-containing protein [Denitrobaculum tricleocarpae]TQV79641.1 DUF938 domain-containing protein [Denitrobaculum tricleocarpae]
MTQSDQEPDARRFSPAIQRNREPLLDVLAKVLPQEGRLLEIASGSGEHAVWFAPRFPDLTWQTSDLNPELRQSIASHIAHADLSLPAPLDIDVTRRDWGTEDAPLSKLDAIFCANMIHIAPWAATLGLLDGAARYLKTGGKLCLYGPYKRGGTHTAPSNAAFDQSLRAQNPEWGVRDLEVVTEEAGTRGLAAADIIEMPSNNLTVIFQR